jgi:hypothetical protein
VQLLEEVDSGTKVVRGSTEGEIDRHSPDVADSG